MMLDNFRTIESLDQFQSQVLNYQGLAIVDFFAYWCGDCRQHESAISPLADEFCDKIKFFKIDTDRFPQLEKQWNIQLIPTVIIFNGGKELTRLVNEKSGRKYWVAFESLIESSVPI